MCGAGERKDNGKRRSRSLRDGSQKNKGSGIDSCQKLEVVVRAEVADYIGGVAVLGVYGEVHGSHVVGGDFVG